MKTQPIEPFNELCTTALDIMERLDKTNTKVWKELTNEQLNMVRMGVDYGNRQLEIWLSRETPANILAAQSGIAWALILYMGEAVGYVTKCAAQVKCIGRKCRWIPRCTWRSRCWAPGTPRQAWPQALTHPGVVWGSSAGR
jgi:hypothetical protein